MTFKLFSRVLTAAVIGGLALSAGACSLFSPPEYRDPDGRITAAASIDSSALKTGDCIVSVSDLSDEITKLAVVPCSEAHEGEVYAVGEGLANDKATLEEFCTAQFEPYIGIGWEDSQLSATYIHSSQSKATTDVQCIVYSEGVMVMQSYRGSQQ